MGAAYLNPPFLVVGSTRRPAQVTLAAYSLILTFEIKKDPVVLTTGWPTTKTSPDFEGDGENFGGRP
tara:strand:+ start:24977 stop:25177 length:201 start_codon:yes stop_codon:yes gene_type:complete